MTDAAAGADSGATPARVGVGEALARARCSIGLSIEDVAQQLKFSVRLLEALEQGRIAELPGGVFARGMVRSYARLVKLDARPLVQQLAEVTSAGPAIDDAVSFRKPIPFADTARGINVGYALLTLGALALIALVLLEWPHDRAEVGTLPRPEAPAPVASAAEKKEAVVPMVTPLAAVSTPGVVSDAAPAAPAAAAHSAPEPQRVLLRFEGTSWVEVRGADGRVLVSGLHGAGATRSLEGAGPFSLVIGNAQKVKLSHNGRAIDLAPHSRLDVARLKLE